MTNDPTPTFAFSSEPGATFECSIDIGVPAFAPCSDTGSDTPSNPLADGPYTFRVRATDEAQNKATSVRQFQVDTAGPPAPHLSGTSPASPANQNRPKIVGTGPAGSTVKLYESTNCGGTLIATLPAGNLIAGVEVEVADDSTTYFTATATSSAENTSDCSDPTHLPGGLHRSGHPDHDQPGGAIR